MIPPPPRSTLFPYTTLFRSSTSSSASRTTTSATTSSSAATRPGFADDEVVADVRSEEHTSELQSHSDLVCRLLLEKKKKKKNKTQYDISHDHVNNTKRYSKN